MQLLTNQIKIMNFKINVLVLIGIVLIATSCEKKSNEVESAEPAVKAVWSASGRWDTWQNGGYTLYNNIWGSGYGPQSIWANSYSNWGVWANHPNGGGIKSYPNSERAVNKQLSALGSCTSSFNCTVPGGGSYNTAYDIWCDNYTYEIMLWMNWKGAVGPIAGSYNSSGQPVAEFTNVSVGGHTWNVYKGSNGANAVYSFLRTSQTTSGTVDIKAILNWIKGKNWFGNVTLSKVQLGWEITSSSGGMNFNMNSYSVSYN